MHGTKTWTEKNNVNTIRPAASALRLTKLTVSENASDPSNGIPPQRQMPLPPAPSAAGQTGLRVKRGNVDHTSMPSASSARSMMKLNLADASRPIKSLITLSVSS
ncbi:hypothetical protein Pla52n_15930 [Stieleria varia]|uniref:Uncharacterized protein n=1 Tax=Stieleria varia TaxID=2528005 RepID=A0A5C6B1U8_9BACT|nr:hypothetical protein Pla52n_15930 [Stieleria varia]